MTESVEVLTVDFEIPNNGDYVKTWGLTDKDTDASLISVSDEVWMDIKPSQDLTTTATLELRTTGDDSITGIKLAADVGTSGDFAVTIRRSDLEDKVPTGSKKVTFYYDLGVKYAGDDFFIVYAKGRITLDMGVTDID